MILTARPLRALGLGFLASAAGLALIAAEQMRRLAAYGFICGANHPHSPACAAALAAAVLGLGALAASAAGLDVRPALALAPRGRAA